MLNVVCDSMTGMQVINPPNRIQNAKWNNEDKTEKHGRISVSEE